ncbi:POT family proton-dependent oligopeptide transporter [Spinactinospora alkalitolerans]|uniref:POT family proton-dependent oligopeptide transporter n=1 Tax=Spinactinospora alkalitolerans TaxID=687207 RepID=A0A852TUY0_9ACTN|nr:peptide MFS transporter [Spinactinospora alkalitolerans]NYE47748.1 POT family proton-dependent oligopeptide transporter [Spinactinospora alkalitolerans]
MSIPTEAGKRTRGFLGHPRGLATLFFTEAWERFSYYGMRALLLYYMYDRVADGGLGIDNGTALSLVAVYGSAIYMAAIAGGWVSDRLLGVRRCTLYGGILIMCGHVFLALPAGTTALYVSMIFIVLGTGLLKPNISISVGDLYADKDLRRDSGFTIYYMGISIGALLAPLTVGTLGQRYDYHLGFGLAAIGMAIGLLVYVRGQRHLSEAGRRPANPLRASEIRSSRTAWPIAAAAALTVLAAAAAAVSGRLTADLVVDAVSVLSIALPVTYFTMMLRSGRTTPEERSRVLAYIPLFMAAVCFWIIQEQGAIVLAQYARQSTDLDLSGFEIPSSWFQSVGSLVLIVLAPCFAAMWLALGRRSRQPSTPAKFGMGLLFAGASYALLVIPALGEQKSGPLWLVASFALVTVGELCLSPIGLSATTRLAPAAFATQTMGIWLASGAAGQGISAQIVGFYDRGDAALYFGVIGACAVLLGLLFVIAPAVRTRTEGAEADADSRERVQERP